MRSHKTLRIAYTPDSDDAFYYDALETGCVTLAGYALHFCRAPMSELNRAALHGTYEVTAISSVIYPQIAEQYAILSVGTSVGRGYGPVLVGREPRPLDSLHGARVGVAGIPTTGWFLLRLLCPGAIVVEMDYDRISAAVVAGDLDAGVMIHEELLYYPALGLARVADLGAEWCKSQGLPLPVGLNVVRRDQGPLATQHICAAIRRSLRHAFANAEEALGRVSRFGRGRDGGVTEQFVAMFANADSLWMPRDVRMALRVLFAQVVDQGLAHSVPRLDIVEGNELEAMRGHIEAAEPTEESIVDLSQQLLAAKRDFLVPCVYHFYQRPPVLVRGEGAFVHDAEGRRYLDCLSGVSVMNAGHSNPEIIGPAIEQLRRLQHTTTIYLTEPMLDLARVIAELAPPPLRRSFFCASGSEANEGALLLATLATGRRDCVYLRDGLHGRTKWAMSVTGLDMWRTDPDPLVTAHAIPGPRHPESLDALERLLRKGTIAAVIAEPIQGNGGIVVPPDHYWPELRRLCDSHGTLLIADEIQTAWNRTGLWFATQHWQVVPDIITVAKALGNGFPIAAYITSDVIAAHYTRPGAATFGGNLVSCRAALATLAFHQRHRLGERSTVLGDRLRDQLVDLQRRRPEIAEVRGLGLMIGVELRDGANNPAAALTDAVLERMKDAGFLLGKTGPGRNVLTLMPPLVVPGDALDTVGDALDAALRSAG